MAKDPAFLFYPGDFNTGTQFFTDEQVGKYMRLLMAQHQHGHLTDNHVLHICKTYDKDVMNKFVKDSDGLWYNERLEIEVNKRKKYCKSRSENRSNPKEEKKISSTYVPHMENRNGINNNINEPDFFETNAQAYMLISGNYHDTEAATKIIANNGWPAVAENDVKALIHHFIESQVEVKKQTRDDIRSHLRRWLNKQPVDKLRGWAKTIIENHGRKQGQPAKIRGTAGGIPG